MIPFAAWNRCPQKWFSKSQGQQLDFSVLSWFSTKQRAVVLGIQCLNCTFGTFLCATLCASLIASKQKDI
jgi:hypothetical protein